MSHSCCSAHSRQKPGRSLACADTGVSPSTRHPMFEVHIQREQGPNGLCVSDRGFFDFLSPRIRKIRSLTTHSVSSMAGPGASEIPYRRLHTALRWFLVILYLPNKRPVGHSDGGTFIQSLPQVLLIRIRNSLPNLGLY